MSAFSKLSSKLAGPVFPIVTPFQGSEGQSCPPIDYYSLGRYIDLLINGGAKVIMVASATSRFAQLTVREIIELNAFCLEHVGGRALLVPSTPITGPTCQHLDVAKAAKSDGAAVIICEYPWRYQSAEALATYFNDVADSSGLGIVLHVTPSRSEVRTTHDNTHRYEIEALRLVCENPAVIGMKEASGDTEHSRAIWKEFADRMSIIVAGRATETYLNALPYGVAGFFSAVGSIIPEYDGKVYALARSGETTKALQLSGQLDVPFLNAAKPLGWHAALKGVLAEMGLMEATERPPMVPLPEQKRKELYHAYVHGHR